MYWHYYEPTGKRRAAAKESIDHAMILSPEAPEVRAALGWYYFHGVREYENAMREFNYALERQPSNSECMAAMAQIDLRLGNYEIGEKRLRQAVRLCPRDPDTLLRFGIYLSRVRKYQEAIAYVSQAIKLKPNEGRMYQAAWELHIVGTGDVTAARRILDESERAAGNWRRLSRLRVQLDMIEGQFEPALQRLNQDPETHPIRDLDDVHSYQLKADVLRHLGRSRESHRFYECTQQYLEAETLSEPNVPYLRACLGHTYAGLGMKEEAIREGNLAYDICPEDAIHRSNMAQELAVIYTMLGEYEKAMDLIDVILSSRCFWSATYFCSWPDYAVLRDMPRFSDLMREHGAGPRTSGC